MKTAILKYVKILDRAAGGQIRGVWSRYQTHFGPRSSQRSRAVVRDLIGKHSFRRLNDLKVVVFPNRLQATQNLWQRGYAIEKIFHLLRIQPIQYSPWEKYDICINWQDLTKNLIDPRQYISNSYDYTKTPAQEGACININFDCNDISKRRIGEVNRAVFGYELDVDPVVYEGKVVCKSDENAAHDGRVIDCPITEAEIGKNKVYSVAIDNIKNGFAVDYRVPYIKGLCGFFYEKRRPVSNRFSNTNSSVLLRELEDEFSAEEIALIEKFCAAIGADYGEFDVLRDAGNGKIYIVDFAKTPAGPPNGLPPEQMAVAIERMSTAFAVNIAMRVFK